VFLLVLAHPGSPGQRAVKWSLLLFMVALWNRETIYIFMLWFVLLLSSFFLFFLT